MNLETLHANAAALLDFFAATRTATQYATGPILSRSNALTLYVHDTVTNARVYDVRIDAAGVITPITRADAH